MKKLMICLFVFIIMFFFQACRKDQEQTINKVVINEFPDITSYTTEGLGSNNPYLSLSNVTTNIVRRSNTIVVYTALEDYEVNQSGIEIAVNAYNEVVEKNVIVSMPEGGFVVSGTGSYKTILERIKLGDFIYYNYTSIYVYRVALPYNSILLEAKDLVKKIDLNVNDNHIRTLANSLIEVVNDFLSEESTSTIDEIKIMLDYIKESDGYQLIKNNDKNQIYHDLLFNHEHKYLYLESELMPYSLPEVVTSSQRTLIELRNNLCKKINTEINSQIPHDYQYMKEIIDQIDLIINQYDEREVDSVYTKQTYFNDLFLIKAYANIISANLLDYEINQERGIWYYPFINMQGVDYYDDTSKEGIVNTLTRFKRMGINSIFLMLFTDLSTGYCLYDSSYFIKYPYLDEACDYDEYSKDYLQCFISEAHKLGIAVNAYTQTFYAHYTMKNFKEEYIIIDDDGNIPKWDSYGDVANFDVCNEELQEILLSWYQELITKYDWDGVEYDVIRYPYGNLGEKLNDSKIKRSDLVDYGYNSGTVQKFMDKYQLTGDLATLICENKDIRIQWFNYKIEALNSFVAKCSQMIRQIKPKLTISAAVFPSIDGAKISYLQDYRTWCLNGYLDALEPMCYTTNVDTFNSQVQALYQASLGVKIRVGTSVKVNNYEDDSVDLAMLKALEYHSSYVLFSSHYYCRSKNFMEMLANNHHAPFISNLNNDEEKLEALISDTMDMIDNYYQKSEQYDFSSLLNAFATKDLDNILNIINSINELNIRTYLKKRFEALR